MFQSDINELVIVPVTCREVSWLFNSGSQHFAQTAGHPLRIVVDGRSILLAASVVSHSYYNSELISEKLHENRIVTTGCAELDSEGVKIPASL
jgi:hypothetical protein